MYKIWSVGLIIVYVLLLILAIYLLLNGFICDDHTCRPMMDAKAKTKTSKKEQLYLLSDLCQEGLWPFAYIASSILAGLIFSILPMHLDIKTYTVVFLVTFIVFYCIIGFFIHHYVVPIKKYIMEYIQDHKNDQDLI